MEALRNKTFYSTIFGEAIHINENYDVISLKRNSVIANLNESKKYRHLISFLIGESHE